MAIRIVPEGPSPGVEGLNDFRWSVHMLRCCGLHQTCAVAVPLAGSAPRYLFNVLSGGRHLSPTAAGVAPVGRLVVITLPIDARAAAASAGAVVHVPGAMRLVREVDTCVSSSMEQERRIGPTRR